MTVASEYSASMSIFVHNRLHHTSLAWLPRRKITTLDLEAQTSQDNHERLCNHVFETFKEKTLKHPVISSRRNLCLTKDEEFKEFKMTQLRAIANHLNVQVKGRKKIDLVTSIVSFLGNCKCKQKNT